MIDNTCNINNIKIHDQKVFRKPEFYYKTMNLEELKTEHIDLNYDGDLLLANLILKCHTKEDVFVKIPFVCDTTCNEVSIKLGELAKCILKQNIKKDEDTCTFYMELGEEKKKFSVDFITDRKDCCVNVIGTRMLKYLGLTLNEDGVEIKNKKPFY